MESLKLFSENQEFSHHFIISPEIIELFKTASKDSNPVHFNSDYAISKGFREPIAFGNILGFGVSHLVGMGLPTEEVIILSQSIDFHKPAYKNDKIQLVATVKQVIDAVSSVNFGLKFFNQDQVMIAKGKLLIKCL